MWALLARLLGSAAAKKIGMQTAKEIFKRYGAKTLRQFAKEVDLADLANMSMDDILAKAGQVAQKVTLTPSNAKKFAAVVNKKIDSIEKLGRQWASRRIIASGAEEVGIPVGGVLQGAAAKSKAGKFFTNKILAPIILPTRKADSFASGYLRGLTGETLSRAVTRMVEFALGVPRTAANLPKYRNFLKVATGEIKYLRSIGELDSAKKLYNAVKLGMNAAQSTYPQSPHLLRYSLAGNLAGRATVAIGVDYAFIEDDERAARIERFQQSLRPFVNERVRIYVAPYTRSDGTKVKGHYRVNHTNQGPRQHVNAYTKPSGGFNVRGHYREMD